MEQFLYGLNSLFPMFMTYFGSGLLVFARVVGFFRFAPLLNRKEIFSMVRLCLAILVTVMIVSVIQPKPLPFEDFGSLLVSLILNYAVGAMIGYVAQLLLLAIEAGGDMINMQMGLSSAMVLDPTTQSQTSILSRIFGLLGILIFIQVGGIYWLFRALMRTFEIFPVFATSVPLEQLVNLDYVIQLSSNVLYMGLQIASPVLLATLGQDIILGVISKTAPQVNVFQLSFLFKPVLGAAIMIWILPMLFSVISDYFNSFANIF